MRRILSVSMVALAVAVAAGCGAVGTGGSAPGGSSAPPPSTPATTAPATTTTTTTAPTAADDLAAYFAAAERVDAHLHAAATLINGDIGKTESTFGAATVAAVKAADPGPAAARIPAGLQPSLRRAVILVQSDLASRWYAFRPVREGSTGVPSQDRERLMTCLEGGARAAARFDADLAAARSLASAAPPVTRAAPASRAAAELAVLLNWIDLANGGCDSCGGQIATTLPAIRWHRIANPYGAPWDGTIGAILFRASYHAATGWQVRLNAC